MKYEAFLLAYGLSASSAFFFVPLLRRLGLVSHPRPDRLGERKIALAGGFSLLFGFVFTLFVFGLFSEKELFSVALLSIAVGIIGFLDDIRHLPPSAKLSLLLLTSGALILSGVFVNIYFPVLGVPLSFLWFAGVPNAFNLIDNADGIASGVGAISAFTIGVSAYIDENLPCSIAALSLAGASCGVLVHNFPPARVFLGDCGSLSLGFALSALAVIATWREASSLLMMLTIPLLFVALPLFDTLFVTVSRLSRGISPLQGGVDHTAHRLLRAGFSPRRVALLAYLASAVLGVITLLSKEKPLLLLLSLLGVALSALVVALALPSLNLKLPVAAVIKRFTLTILIVMDALIFAFSFVLAYLARFDLTVPEVYLPVVSRALPVVVSIKLTVFYLGGGYHKDSKYSTLARNSALATICAIAAFTIALRFENLSRGVFIIDFFITSLLCALARKILSALSRGSDET